MCVSIHVSEEICSIKRKLFGVYIVLDTPNDKAKIKTKKQGAKKKKKSTTPQQNADGEAHEISSDELVGETAQQANSAIPSSEDSNSVIGASNITTEMSASSKSAEVSSENSGRRISVDNPTGEQKIDSKLDRLLSFSSPNTHPDLAKQTSDVTMQDSQVKDWMRALSSHRVNCRS